jgi:hypothetical protein
MPIGSSSRSYTSGSSKAGRADAPQQQLDTSNANLAWHGPPRLVRTDVTEKQNLKAKLHVCPQRGLCHPMAQPWFGVSTQPTAAAKRSMNGMQVSVASQRHVRNPHGPWPLLALSRGGRDALLGTAVRSISQQQLFSFHQLPCKVGRACATVTLLLCLRTDRGAARAPAESHRGTPASATGR